MRLEKQQQKNTEQKKNTHLNLSYVDYEDVYGPNIIKFNLNTIRYKLMIGIYKYKSVTVWILNNLNPGTPYGTYMSHVFFLHLLHEYNKKTILNSHQFYFR